MFLIDKYRITNLCDILYHNDIYDKLFEKKDYKTLLNQIKDVKTIKMRDVICGEYNNFPNIFIHGPNGSGKKTLINLILKDMFGDEVFDIKKEEYSILLFTLDMVKNKNKFKVVIINNIDKLSYYAQTSLRCSMEKYIHNCKFILCGYNMSKVIDPLKGRCLSIRLSKPTDSDIYRLLLNISAKENKLLKQVEYNEIIKKCERNPKLALWLLETKYLGLNLELIFWKNNLKQVVEIIMKIINKKDVEHLELMTIRNLIYEVYITNIDENEIINELFFELNKSIKNKEVLISRIFRKYDYRNIIGKRLMIQLEALIFNLIRELI